MSAKSDEKCYRIAELYKLIFKRREIEQLVQHSLSQSYQTFLSGRRGSWSWYSAGALQIITHETFILCNFAAHDIWQFKNYVPWVFSPFGSLAQGLLGVLWLLSTFIPASDTYTWIYGGMRHICRGGINTWRYRGAGIRFRRQINSSLAGSMFYSLLSAPYNFHKRRVYGNIWGAVASMAQSSRRSSSLHGHICEPSTLHICGLHPPHSSFAPPNHNVFRRRGR